MNLDEFYLFLALHYAIQPTTFSVGMSGYLDINEFRELDAAIDKYIHNELGISYVAHNSAAMIIQQNDLLQEFEKDYPLEEINK